MSPVKHRQRWLQKTLRDVLDQSHILTPKARAFIESALAENSSRMLEAAFTTYQRLVKRLQRAALHR